jgi:hypothetical protein
MILMMILSVLLNLHPYLHMARLIGLAYLAAAAVSGLVICAHNGGC